MLKLAKRPDRTPVRIIINVNPDTNRALAAYAEAYRQTYGTAENVADLIPFMLDAFLAGDRDFAKARKEKPAPEVAPAPPRPRRSRKPAAPPPPATIPQDV